jgi:hypothetical protein
MRGRLLWLGVLLAVTGCARAVGLDVSYPDAGANPAMLASAAPRRVAIGPVVDRRGQTRIGVEPDTRKDIVTSRPVADIVRDALAVELAKNGHTVVSGDKPDLVVSADVADFRLDHVVGYSSTQYVGKVAIALAVSDAHTGQRLVSRRYVGIKRRLADADAKRVEREGLEREVMDAALARTLHDLATDPELVRALVRLSAAASP